MSDDPQPAAPQPRVPAQTRDTATVVLLRDGLRGLETYLVKRSRTVDFMAGAHVFPGGRLDKADSLAVACALLSADTLALRQRLAEDLPAMHLAPATAKSLDMLAGHADVDAALAGATARTPPIVEPKVWNEAGRAFISLPGDPRHALPDMLGGTIRRIQLEAGRYRTVPAA